MAKHNASASPHLISQEQGTHGCAAGPLQGMMCGPLHSGTYGTSHAEAMPKKSKQIG
ncbi:MAG: hypothetical protein IT230_05395 [Flavobacteriales bacterium]|nr:hypothetical protein [Flavobacteriales bacterium]